MSNKIITNTRIRLITCDWDARAQADIFSGMGFRITEKGKSDTDHNAGYFSIHSPLYGTDYNDDNAFEDRYSCECGRLTGKNYIGKKCAFCGKVVEHVDIDMRTTGWIILDREVIINPIFFKKIQSFIGKKILDNIVKYKDESKRDATSQYDGIGLIEFRERFSEIMNYYLKKNGSKKLSQYMFIMSQIDIVFAHAIPVYSSHLRPFIIRAEEIKYTKDDELYRHIYSNSTLLNNRYELERRAEKAKTSSRIKDISYLRRENILWSIQRDINELWEFSFDVIKKKTGTIRDKILGGRLNYTARNVIIPSKDLRSDEIEIGYTTFLELYKLEIVSLLISMNKIPQAEAWHMWDKATVIFDPSIYKIMQYMVSKRNVIVEINRNPTEILRLA